MKKESQNLPKDIFRAYDIRGIVDEQLTPELMNLLGRSYATEMLDQGLKRIAIGFDGRLSSPSLNQGLIEGLLESGIDVVSIGMVPTPCLYFAVSKLKTDAGIMITGSHNPTSYNGCKMLMDGESVALAKIQKLYQNMVERNFPAGKQRGTLSEESFLPRYIDCLVDGIQLKKSYKIIVDSGNGVTGICAPEVYRRLGCEVTELFCEVDGSFPNHHPDPGNPKNLVEAQNKVNDIKADAGFAFDGDGDRLGLVSNSGKIIFPDRMIMLFAEDLLSRHPGAPIIYDVKCSSLLAKLIRDNGGEPVMWNTGHSLIKKKMKETESLFAGEMSGHLFFAENWPLSDDALLAGVRLLQIMDNKDADLDTVFSSYPEMSSTPEINLSSQEDAKFKIIDALRSNKARFDSKEIVEIDGIRVEYEDGWGLARASNTSPVIVLRFEATSDRVLNRIIDKFVEELGRISPELDFTNLLEAKK